MKSIFKFWMLLLVPAAISAQNVGIGVTSPLGTLDVLRGTAPNGTALFRGTTHASAFNFGTAEDTYIRGGKNGSNVVLNDETLGRVGIGTNAPQGTLDVARGTGPNGTAQFRGTTHVSHFNYGTAEDTYIRGGKNLSNVIINDETQGYVGIGVSSPTAMLDVIRGSAPGGTAKFRGTTFTSFFNYGTTEDTYINGGKAGSNVIINNWAMDMGMCGIGTSMPTGTLDVVRGSAFNGTAVFRGTDHASHFNFGTTEDTYIRGGKDGSNVIINDGSLGYVGIGTTSPQTKLHVNRNTEALRISGFNSFMSVYDNSGNAIGYFQNNSGSIDIGTFVANTNGEVRLKTKGQLGLTVQSDGNVLATGSLTSNANISAGTNLSLKGQLTNYDFNTMENWMQRVSSSANLDFFKNGILKAFVDNDGDWIDVSDKRLKEDISNYKPVLDEIKNLQVSTYRYKTHASGQFSFGLIAQNVAEFFPEIVSQTEDLEGRIIMGIAYGKTGVLAIKAIQEQQVIIEEQQKRIEMLEKRLSALEQARVP